MQPTVGRVVHYTLTGGDADAILLQRTRSGGGVFNQAKAGDVYPAVIVRIFGGPAVNLQVLLDGPDTYWATSRSEGEDAGRWVWPPRA